MVDSLGCQNRRMTEQPTAPPHHGGFSRFLLDLVTTERDRARPIDIKRSLFSTICGRPSNVFMVAIAMALCGLAALVRDGGWLAPTVAAVGFVLFVIRCGTITEIRRLQAALLPIDPDLWLVRFSSSAIGSSICWGLLSFLALARSHDSVLIMITVIANVGSSGAVAARNSGAPKLAKLMLLLSGAPIMAGACFADDNGYLLLVVLVPAMTFGLFILIREHNDQLVDLFVSQQSFFRLSNIDFLTQVSNRRHFDELLAIAVARNGPAWTPFSILILDVDYFKAFNDQYGHPDGDRCLQQIAATLLKSTRHFDVVSRYGGEEFAILLENADPAAALIVARRIREAVEGMGRPHDNRPDGIAAVTVSIGISSMHRGDTDSEALIKAADDALYSAKRNGRNQVAELGAAPEPGRSDEQAGPVSKAFA